MMKDKKSKIMLGVIIGLVLIIGVLTAVIISLSGKRMTKQVMTIRFLPYLQR